MQYSKRRAIGESQACRVQVLPILKRQSGFNLPRDRVFVFFSRGRDFGSQTGMV